MQVREDSKSFTSRIPIPNSVPLVRSSKRVRREREDFDVNVQSYGPTLYVSTPAKICHWFGFQRQCPSRFPVWREILSPLCARIPSCHPCSPGFHNGLNDSTTGFWLQRLSARMASQIGSIVRRYSWRSTKNLRQNRSLRPRRLRCWLGSTQMQRTMQSQPHQGSHFYDNSWD
jgi:hypothetical protein